MRFVSSFVETESTHPAYLPLPSIILGRYPVRMLQRDVTVPIERHYCISDRLGAPLVLILRNIYLISYQMCCLNVIIYRIRFQIHREMLTVESE